MSVVNKMLKDLENREQSQIYTANYIPNAQNKMWMLLGIALLLFSVTAISTVYIAFNAGTISPAPPANIKEQETQAIEMKKGDQLAVAQPLSSDENLKNNTLVNQSIINEAPINAQSESVSESVSQYKTQTDDFVINKATEPTQNTAVFEVSPSDGAKAGLSSLRARAHMAAQENNDEKVIAILNEILFLAPQEHRTRKQLAALLFSKKQFQEAQNTLEEGLAITPDESSLRLMLSRIFFKAGDNANAFSILSQHPYDSLANDEFVSFRAALAEKIGNYDRAQQDYQLLVQRNPNDAKWWLGLGVSQDKQKKAEQALSSYQQAQSLNQLPKQVDSFVSQRIQLLAGQF